MADHLSAVGKRQAVGQSQLHDHAALKVAEFFGLTAEKSWYAHHFYTAKNMKHVGPGSDVSYSCMDHMCNSERKDLQTWYENVAKNEFFVKRRVLECHYQNDVMVLREV